MASLFDNDFSSDSEDEDYVPEAPVSSDEDPMPSSDENETHTNPKETKRTSKSIDSESKITPENIAKKCDDKKRAADVFKSFLEEIEAENMNRDKESESGISSGSTTSSPIVSSSDVNRSGQSSASEKTPEKKEICDSFNFAGETVTVTKDGTVLPDSTKSEKNSSSLVPPVKRKGLESVLASISKKPKISTLEKTALDWKAFKRDEGISLELEQYNKGKNGYIERQRFLERSDVRSYEVERDMRLSRVKKS